MNCPANKRKQRDNIGCFINKLTLDIYNSTQVPKAELQPLNPALGLV